MITLNEFTINDNKYLHQIDGDGDKTQITLNGKILYTVDSNSIVYQGDFEKKIGRFMTDSYGYCYFIYDGCRYFIDIANNKSLHVYKKNLIATELAFFKQTIQEIS